MKIILNKKQFKLLTESGGSIGKAGKIGNFDIPSYNKISDFVSWMGSNRTKFISALSDVSTDAERKFNAMESLFKLAESGNIRAGELINGVPVEQYITRQGGLRDEFIRLSSIKEKTPILRDGKSVLDNSQIPKEDYDRMIKKFNSGYGLTNGWKYFGADSVYPHSGWKFHIYGEDMYDSAFLYDRLEPVMKKWGAQAKVGVLQDFQPLEYYTKKGYSYDEALNMSKQFGKKGASIYIPAKVYRNNQQREFLSDIQSAIEGYEKKGGISGDKSISDNITYRYELDRPIDYGEGVKDRDTYHSMYAENRVGSKYKPDDVPDLFTNEKGPDLLQPSINKNTIISGTRVGSNYFDNELIDWSKIDNAKNIQEYNKIISQALKTGDYSKISKGGFEEYGIEDFQNFLRTKVDLESQVMYGGKDGTWGFKVK